MSKELAKTYDPQEVEDRIVIFGCRVAIFTQSVIREKPYNCDSAAEYYRTAAHGACSG